MSAFSYAEFTTRNVGFVTAEQQRRLRESCVFICGTGGMGGAALMALARAGVGHFILADIDAFETSNLNRQVFAFSDTLGRHKAEASAQILTTINPELRLEVLKEEWPEHLPRIAGQAQALVNGADDLAAGLHLYRTARRLGKPVVDAYASPLPSVYVTRPGDPMPEERLGYPTIGRDWRDVTAADRAAAFQAEVVHVMTHSSSARHVDLRAAGEVAAGRRSRMSFAPMVITTGMLMAWETIALLLGQRSGTDCRGWFFNPHRQRVETPRPAPVAALMRPLVRRYLKRLTAGA